MENSTVLTNEITPVIVMTPEALLDHWQGHRKLTRRVIEAFPENELFQYSAGGMRPFSELALEMVNMAGPGIRGIATNECCYGMKRLNKSIPIGPGYRLIASRKWCPLLVNGKARGIGYFSILSTMKFIIVARVMYISVH